MCNLEYRVSHDGSRVRCSLDSCWRDVSQSTELSGTNRSVTSVDIDPDALGVARQNIESVEMEDEITLLHAKISNNLADLSTSEGDAVALFDYTKLEQEIDTVVMNPPFGSWVKGIDMVFLEVAAQASRRCSHCSTSAISLLIFPLLDCRECYLFIAQDVDSRVYTQEGACTGFPRQSDRRDEVCAHLSPI